jgi:hypothetical protein
MGMRIYATRQNEEPRGIHNSVSIRIDMSAHLAYGAALREHIRLLNTICGDDSAILNQDSHTRSELFNAA